jgi:hypothetical protein
MSTYSRVPENYDLRKTVQALITELEDARVLDSGRTRAMIIEKGSTERKKLGINQDRNSKEAIICSTVDRYFKNTSGLERYTIL